MSLRLRRSLRRLFRTRTQAGTHRVVTDIPGPGPDGTRTVVVHLPGGYDEEVRRYPVVYMQDGQNLFDQGTSFAGSWGLSEELVQASRLGADAIIVGIHHANQRRIDEYSPFVDERVGGGDAAAYVTWLVDVLRPVINERYRTLVSREQTGIAGSSMGGLLSLYAVFERPEVFGFAAVMSPSLWFANGAIFEWVRDKPFADTRIYLDIGAREGERTLTNAQRLRDLLIAKGYMPGELLRWVEDSIGVHHESAWGRRFRKALPALLALPKRQRSA
ncbi:MAG TPA: alpha/beta hydrolase-fold protein [Gemmatimonadaceae bacterium]|nr:alpha/beta hydrolase-fold protein [Gemmatimonadaceae bacterium]